jgi:hypothetical protein
MIKGTAWLAVNEKTGGLKPGWLFITIVAILLGHYIYLGIALSACYNILTKESEIKLEQARKAGLDPGIKRSDLPQSGRICDDIDQQFRNARNKALEIILALLVPSGVVGAAYAVQPRKPPPPPPKV